MLGAIAMDVQTDAAKYSNVVYRYRFREWLASTPHHRLAGGSAYSRVRCNDSSLTKIRRFRVCFLIQVEMKGNRYMILLETPARGTSDPLLFLALGICLVLYVIVSIRSLQAQLHYLQLLQKKLDLKIPTLADPQGQMPVQMTSFVINNWRYLPYLFRAQADAECEQSRKQVIRRFIQTCSVFFGSGPILFGIGVLTSR